MAFLLEAHGIQRVTEFLRQCGPSGRDSGAAFERVFGESLDQAGEAWRAAIGDKARPRA